MPVRGLTIVVADADAARLRTALGLVAAQAALGGAAGVFLDSAAVALLQSPDSADACYHAAGLPTRAELIATALDLGVALTLCQSGIALAGIDLATLDPRIAAGGLTAILATLGEDRLVVV